MTNTPHLLFDRELQRKRIKRIKQATLNELAQTIDSSELVMDILDDTVRPFPKVLLVGKVDAGLIKTLNHNQNRLGIDELVNASSLISDVDDEHLPYPPEHFDLVLSCFCLHGVNHIPQTLFQYHQLLKPNGLLIAHFWGGYSLMELRHAFLLSESATNKVAPRVAPAVDVKDAGRLLQQAGFENPVSDVNRLCISYDSPLSLLNDIRAIGESNALINRSRQFITRGLLAQMAQTYQAEFGDSEGRIPATVEIITLTGWKKR